LRVTTRISLERRFYIEDQVGEEDHLVGQEDRHRATGCSEIVLQGEQVREVVGGPYATRPSTKG
jgi:hypothetical protein